jgi:hypothetical protein
MLTMKNNQLLRLVFAKKPLRTGTTFLPPQSGQEGFAFSRWATVMAFSNWESQFRHRKT